MKLPVFFKKEKFISINRLFPKVKSNTKINDVATLSKSKKFDLVISLATLHNLSISELKNAVSEIQRVGKKKYIMVESFRNDQELFNLQCWALTCQSFFSVKEWIWLFKNFNYSGDYEFIYFK